MRMVTSVATMQRLALRWRRAGRPIGFVPTMGYLHEGHISLVKKARQSAARRVVVVVSIYVNPTQFAPTEDLAGYPRDLTRDKRLCRDAGVDALFVPDDKHLGIRPERELRETASMNLSRVISALSIRYRHLKKVSTLMTGVN